MIPITGEMLRFMFSCFKKCVWNLKPYFLISCLLKAPTPHVCPSDHRQICQDSTWSAKSWKMQTLHLQTDSSRDLFSFPLAFFLFLRIVISSQFVQHCSSDHINYSLCNKERLRHQTPKLPHKLLNVLTKKKFPLWKIDIDKKKKKLKWIVSVWKHQKESS